MFSESKSLFEKQPLVPCASWFLSWLAALCLQEEAAQVRSPYFIEKQDITK